MDQQALFDLFLKFQAQVAATQKETTASTTQKEKTTQDHNEQTASQNKMKVPDAGTTETTAQGIL